PALVAEVVPADTAIVARPAAHPGWRKGDAVSLGKLRDVLADGGDDSGHLMADHVGRLHPGMPVFPDFEVGAANGAGLYFHDHIPRPARRHLHLTQHKG